MSVRTVLRS